MKTKKIMLSAIIAFTVLLGRVANAQDTTMAKNKNTMAMDTMPMNKDSMATRRDHRPMKKDSMSMEKNNMAMAKDSMYMDKDNMATANDSMRMGKDKMTMGKDKMQMQSNMMPDLKSWPEASQMAVKEITDKYGKADVMGDEIFMWMDKGPWKSIVINKKETKHSFPVEHTDMMIQTISHKVPTDKYDDLAKFDGSVTVDRTQGLLSARCDVEANNFLALNLAHDIITGKKTVAVARKAFADIVKLKMNGGNPVYMHHLTFKSEDSSADADINTTGLTKADVMNGGKGKMSKNTANAQDNMDSKSESTMHNKMSHPNLKDCLMMKDGKMMQIKAGKTMGMKNDMTFVNGNMVMTDGTMKMKDGTSHMLKEGNCVTMNGKMQGMSAKKKMKDPM